MIYLIFALLLGVSIGLGVLLKKSLPKMEMAMAILLSFVGLMILAIATAEALGKLAP